MIAMRDEPMKSVLVIIQVHPEALSVSFVPALLVGKRQTASLKGAAELLERIGPYAMELLDLCLAELG